MINLLANVSFSIEVATWQFVLSQVFGFFALCGFFISMQQKSTSKLLLWNAFGGVFYLGMFLALEAWVVAVISAAAPVRSITFYFFERKEGRVPASVRYSSLFVFVAIPAVGVILTWADWWDWVLLSGSLIIVLSQFFRHPHFVRLGNTILSVTTLVISVWLFNITGILLEAMVLLSILIFYIRMLLKIGNKDVVEDVDLSKNLKEGDDVPVATEVLAMDEEI